MRGKPVCVQAFAVRTRIIPAHAGQTTPPDWKHWYRTDHPRACGANHVPLFMIMGISGSSPRMRGKPPLTETSPVQLRIIPAHAGQTRSWRRRSQATSDHPRACGANSMTCATCFHGCGSSPRMRGKLANRMLCVPVCRIIPAHAGQTCEASSCSPVTADHPRACGANDL